ncbi:Dicer-like protein 2 [Mycoblastus sanguinarius]|nr:Dicer-like protein 2 [Mycoblastus sanguinarius]
MSISLPQFLRRTPVPALTAALYATRTRFAALEPIFRAAFDYGLVYPWQALAAFAPEKVFSDLIETVLGAIYIDTNGDLKACMAILRRFGVLEWVETALKNNVQIRHPKEEVDRLAGHKKVRYHVCIEDVDDHDPGPMEELVDAG